MYFLFSTSVYISYHSGSLTRQAKRSWARIPAPPRHEPGLDGLRRVQALCFARSAQCEQAQYELLAWGMAVHALCTSCLSAVSVWSLETTRRIVEWTGKGGRGLERKRGHGDGGNERVAVVVLDIQPPSSQVTLEWWDGSPEGMEMSLVDVRVLLRGSSPHPSQRRNECMNGNIVPCVTKGRLPRTRKEVRECHPLLLFWRIGRAVRVPSWRSQLIIFVDAGGKFVATGGSVPHEQGEECQK